MQSVTDNITILVILGMGSAFIMTAAFILLHIRSQNRLLRQQQEAQQAEIMHQKQLLATVIQSQEAERKRIGQDLHDDVGSALSNLRFTLDMYQPIQIEQESYGSFNHSCKQLIDQIINDVRHISHHLSPSILNFYGLNAALNKQLEYVNRAKTLQATINNPVPEVLSGLELPVATALYRVLEELMNNTIKHAGASRIHISFKEENHNLMIEYTDNGKGLPQQADTSGGIGFQNMESRLSTIQATYQIATGLPSGFKFTVSYPLQAEAVGI
jgi:signal transduction histidine kinase